MTPGLGMGACVHTLPSADQDIFTAIPKDLFIEISLS
jgi:hypothetical protein